MENVKEKGRKREDKYKIKWPKIKVRVSEDKY
jgi:hypothetical protein